MLRDVGWLGTHTGLFNRALLAVLLIGTLIGLALGFHLQSTQSASTGILGFVTLGAMAALRVERTVGGNRVDSPRAWTSSPPALDAEWLCALFAVGTLVVAECLAVATGFAARPEWDKTATLYLVIVSAIGAGHLVALLCRLESSSSPARDARAALLASTPRVLRSGATMASLAAFFIGMGWLKSMLPAFWADGLFAGIDRALFGGPPIVAIPGIGKVYLIWHGLQLGAAAYLACAADGPARTRGILALLLTWTIGMALAFAFSSAGPIFTGAPVTDPLVRAEANYLLANHWSGQAMIGAGISAFPSMHVAIAVWMALTFRHWAFWLFAAMTSVGAVTIGWHYSADVVGGVLVAWVAYRLAIVCFPANMASQSSRGA